MCARKWSLYNEFTRQTRVNKFKEFIEFTNYREVLRLDGLGIMKKDITAACECSRNTVASVIKRAGELWLTMEKAQDLSNQELSEKLFPGDEMRVVYKMPDYEYVHREMAKSGVTLSLLWAEYCEQCHVSGAIPYKSTQFNKYYAKYVYKTKATMHIDHKPGEVNEGFCNTGLVQSGQPPYIRKKQEFGTTTPPNSCLFHILLFYAFAQHGYQHR